MWYELENEAFGRYVLCFIYLDSFFTHHHQTTTGKEHFIKTAPGEVLKTQDIKIVEDLGMPVQDTVDFGSLFVLFKVQFPQNGELQDDQVQALEAILGPRDTPKAEIGKEEEEHVLEAVDPQTFGKMEEHERGAMCQSVSRNLTSTPPDFEYRRGKP